MFRLAVMADMHISARIALAGTAGLGHSSGQAAQPGGRCSQGGVKVPTGGKGEEAQAREHLPRDERSSIRKGQQIRCDSDADG